MLSAWGLDGTPSTGYGLFKDILVPFTPFTGGRWRRILSLSEMQALCFARLLFHKPAIAFMDEATSALEVNLEVTTSKYQKYPVCVSGEAAIGVFLEWHLDDFSMPPC